MTNIELRAVNKVSDRISRCALLTGEIAANDKTPFTDGHIDLYEQSQKTKDCHAGRVYVQVKGKTMADKNIKKQTLLTFTVELSALEFYRRHGGCLFFCVLMNALGKKRKVFYVNLLPFKIDKILSRKKADQKTISIKLQPLPKAERDIEKIVALAKAGTQQSGVLGFDPAVMDTAQTFELTMLGPLRNDQPTILDIDHTDFALSMATQGGMTLPIPGSWKVIPASYVPRVVSCEITCGAVKIDQFEAKRTDSTTIELELSSGISVVIKEPSELRGAVLNFGPGGTLRQQIKDIDFMLEAIRGKPVFTPFGALTREPGGAEDLTVFLNRRAELQHVAELLTSLGLPEDFADSLDLADDSLAELNLLHSALVLGEEIDVKLSEFGRRDFVYGESRILLFVGPGSVPGKARLVNPFDPSKREFFRIGNADVGMIGDDFDRSHSIYEIVSEEIFKSCINLCLHELPRVFESLRGERSGQQKANELMLKLIGAADKSREPHRTYLLEGALTLGEWLCSKSGDGVPWQINRWQVQKRLGLLEATDIKEMRVLRAQVVRSEHPQAALREACLAILLDELAELEVVLERITPEELSQLQSWPIWNLCRLALASQPFESE